MKVRFIPYGVNICKTYGNLNDPAVERRKVRYLYLDARRIAKERGLTIYPPKKIFSCRLAFYGGQFAAKHDRFYHYSDRVFERFWKHELDVEKPDAIDGVLQEVGLDVAEFHRYVETDARAELNRMLRGSGGRSDFRRSDFHRRGRAVLGRGPRRMGDQKARRARPSPLSRAVR